MKKFAATSERELLPSNRSTGREINSQDLGFYEYEIGTTAAFLRRNQNEDEVNTQSKKIREVGPDDII